MKFDVWGDKACMLTHTLVGYVIHESSVLNKSVLLNNVNSDTNFISTVGHDLCRSVGRTSQSIVVLLTSSEGFVQE